MRQETIHMLEEFNISSNEEFQLSNKYKAYEEHIKKSISGEGMVGENNYLILWRKSEIEELNDAYEVQEFLNNIFLVGSDGGDIAYGIDTKGQYVEVPFIGMTDEEVKIVAKNFDDFIYYIWRKE